MRAAPVCLLLALLSGCAATDPGPEPTAIAPRGADLTVVVWSEHLQRAVPGAGSVTRLDDASEKAFTIRNDPEAGQLFSGLEPGRYRITARYRFTPQGRQAVAGEVVEYLEPGAKRDVTVVAVDRADDDLGGRLNIERRSGESAARLALSEER